MVSVAERVNHENNGQILQYPVEEAMETLQASEVAQGETFGMRNSYDAFGTARFSKIPESAQLVVDGMMMASPDILGVRRSLPQEPVSYLSSEENNRAIKKMMTSKEIEVVASGNQKMVDVLNFKPKFSGVKRERTAMSLKSSKM